MLAEVIHKSVAPEDTASVRASVLAGSFIGAATDLAFEDYAQAKHYINHSSLVKLCGEGTPAHCYQAWKGDPDDEEKEEKSADQIFGIQFHTRLFEPSSYRKRYLCRPRGDGRTKAVREAIEKLEAENPGCTLIRSGDFQAIERMALNVETSEAGQALLARPGKNELSIFWIDPETGVKCKARIDRLATGILIDAKTVQRGRASKRGFQRSIMDYRYDHQAAMYLEGCRVLGLQAESFVHLVIEKEKPYAMSAYALDSQSLAKGTRDYRKNLRTFADCLNANRWPGYPSEIQSISLPEWAFTQETSL